MCVSWDEIAEGKIGISFLVDFGGGHRPARGIQFEISCNHGIINVASRKVGGANLRLSLPSRRVTWLHFSVYYEQSLLFGNARHTEIASSPEIPLRRVTHDNYNETVSNRK